jgi:hypothetical protein
MNFIYDAVKIIVYKYCNGRSNVISRQHVAKGCRNSEVATDDVMHILSQHVVLKLRGFTGWKFHHSIYTYILAN